MLDSTNVWAKVRQDAARVLDGAAEIERILEWPSERVIDEAEAIKQAFELKDRATGITVLLQITLMRAGLQMSEELSEDMQFALLRAMWAFEWSVDEVKRSLSGVFSRLGIMPPVLAEGIKALLDMASLYRGLKQRARWPNREARIKCVELMWLMGWDEDTVLTETRAAMERFDIRRGDDSKMLDCLREIELIHRRIRNDPAVKSHARKVAEMMWLRGWSLQKAMGEAAALQVRLDLASTTKSVKSLYEMCLLCGGKERPNPVSEAVETIWEDASDEDELEDQRLTSLAEYRWLGSYSLQQAVEKIGRFSRVNAASQHEMFEVLLTLERQRYREEGKHSS